MNDMTEIEAIKANLLALERFVHSLQKDIIELKKTDMSQKHVDKIEKR